MQITQSGLSQPEGEQLELFPQFASTNRLTVAEAFVFLFAHQLTGKPCERPFNSNRKAICKTMGSIYYDVLTEPDILRHMGARRAGTTGKRPAGPQTIKHDLKLLSMLDHSLRRWKKRLYKIDGFNFGTMLLPSENPGNEIKRPRTKARKQVVHPNDFSKWIEHCPERLKRRTYFAIDTGLTNVDLEMLTPQQYNPYNDCLRLTRHKTGEDEFIPVSARCRLIILEAIQEKRKFVLDWTNHNKDVYLTRKRSGVYFWFGRDLRTTFGNKIYQAANNDFRVAQKALLHKDARTTINHYLIESGNDLRIPIREVENEFF